MSAAPGFLRTFAETRGFLLGRPQRVQPTPDGRAVLFLRSPARLPELGLYELDVTTGETRELVTPAEVLGGATEILSEAEKARRERQRVTDRGFTFFALSPDGQGVLLVLSGRLFLFDRTTRETRTLTPLYPEGIVDPRFSPDGRRIAFLRGHDVWVVDLDAAGAEPWPLTDGGTELRPHGVAEFVAQEEMARFEGFWWSPDGDRLAFTEVDQSQVERFAIADPARPERPPHLFSYPRPGKDNAVVRLGLAAVRALGARDTVWVEWDRARYPYLARVLWEAAAAPLALLVQTRDQREAVLLAVDAATGATRPLVAERDDAWVNLDRDLPRWLPDGRGLLWASERSGRRTLEKRHPDGSLDRVVDCGGDFLSLVQIAPDARAAHVLVGDAVRAQLVRVDLGDPTPLPLTGGAAPLPLTGGAAPLPLTGGAAPLPLTADGCDRTVSFSRNGAIFVDSTVAADAWPRFLVRGADGKPIGELPQSAEPPPFHVNLELVRVGARGFNAALIRPHDFVPGRRYPVVLHVYGGPHALMVKADARHYLLDQWIADQGVIVVCIDNRGTPRRDRAWERAIKGAFGEVPLADQVEGLEALGARFPELDLSRVGVYGWSFGGYLAALAVLRRPDVFQVGVAGALVVDWHDYDTHYTERYLDLPAAAPEAYRDASLLSHAAGLRRPLLLVHGTADDNVYFFHSLKLADALFRAGRPFDFLPLPRVTHQIGDVEVRERLWGRMAAYLLAGLGLPRPAELGNGAEISGTSG